MENLHQAAEIAIVVCELFEIEGEWVERDWIYRWLLMNKFTCWQQNSMLAKLKIIYEREQTQDRPCVIRCSQL